MVRCKRGCATGYPCCDLIRNKQGQFFILAAVILVVVIVGLGVVYNTVNVSESSQKFYSYSAQLNKETGAVVDYSLYSGDAKVGNFMGTAVVSVLNSYPELDVFACYTNSSGNNRLNCENYGAYDIQVYTSSDMIPIGPGQTTSTVEFDGGAGARAIHRVPQKKNFDVGSSQSIIVTSAGINYSIDLTTAGAANNQYYFIFRANTSAGNLLVAQGGS
jgi:hypothetical protein